MQLNHSSKSRIVSVGSALAFATLLCLSSAFAADEKQEGAALFNGKDLTGWKLRNKSFPDTWKVVSSVELDKNEPKKLIGTGEGGSADGILFRQPIPKGSDLISEKEFGDCELHVEFMVPKGSNSGVYLMGQYEIQVADSFGKTAVGPGDCGGIYSTKAPTENAAKAPGEWQTFDVVFRAPRFGADGKKTENAKFISVKFNGKLIHENVEAPKGTGGQIGPEKATGPLMLQGDHGIVGYRNIRVTQK